MVTSTTRERIDLNLRAVVEAAVAMELPTVLCTVAVEMGVNKPLVDVITDRMGDQPVIDRTGINAMENPDFARAVRASDRRQVVIGGLWTEVCVAYPALDPIGKGYEVFAVVDAIGGISPTSHAMGVERMVQAGVQPIPASSTPPR